MRLFNQEKDLIQRIVNGCLLVALVIAIFATFTNAVNLILGVDPNSCSTDTCDKNSYEVKDEKYNDTKNLLVSGFSVIVFSTAMILINKDSKTKKQ